MKIVAALLALAAVGALAIGAWAVGEMHRENCIKQNRTSCSVLPWDSGVKSYDEQINVDWGS